MSWKLRIKLAHDVAAGLAAMHSNKPALMHLDLKSPNILLASLDPDANVCAKV